MSRFSYFILLAGMRTGSNLLESNLNALDGVICHGEAFNPGFVGYPRLASLLGMDLPAREADPGALLSRIKESAPTPGFRFFHDHDPRILDHCLQDEACAKIILARNPLESFVSWKIAQSTGQWKLTNAKHAREAKIRFDPDEFAAHLDVTHSFQARIRRHLQSSGQTAFTLDYADLQDVEILNGLAAYLGVADRLKRLRKRFKKQNPGPLAAKVSNPDVMAASATALLSTDPGHAPRLEPARGPATPRYLAAPTAGLLYLPLHSGPDQQVAEWLAAVDDQPRTALQSGLSRRALRDWQTAHVPHRSFSILRHPLARAHAAFCDCILGDGPAALPDLRQKLIDVHGLTLPQSAPDLARQTGYDDTAHRAAFMGFLQFLRQNLQGQTGLRVDAAWASQLALLQGISAVVVPDTLLREEELARDLAALAAAVGRPAAPAIAQTRHRFHHRLTAIYDSALEEAARRAYPGDYTSFGFADLPL